LGAGVDAGRVQLGGDGAVGRTLRDQVDDLQLESVRLATRFRRRLADDAALHTEPAQLAAHPAHIGEGLVAHIGVE
jgi:hypothetical protein